MRILITVAISIYAFQGFASEPDYCQPSEFLKHEIKISTKGLNRARAFRFNQVTVVGLGIGNSDAADVEALAVEMGGVNSSDLYCTWYLNEGNAEAEKKFRHVYLPNPRSLSTREAYDVYSTTLGPEFGKNALSFLSCAEKSKFLSMGCNGMKHRGPTVFGMLLAYSGCSPQNAAQIVNTIWGLNGVKEEVRLAAIQAAYDLGNNEPTYKRAVQERLKGR